MLEPMRTIENLELVGGALCLDFTNTINSRIHPIHDYLATTSGLLDWAAKVRALPDEQIAALARLAQRDKQRSDEALRHTHVMRDMCYRIFSAIAAGVEPHPEDLDAAKKFHSAAVSNGRLVWEGDRYQMVWVSDLYVDTVLWPVAASAMDLLMGGHLSKIKACPGCGWLFLDISKNQVRRWCSMATCGTRAKMRDYHRRGRMESDQ